MCIRAFFSSQWTPNPILGILNFGEAQNEAWLYYSKDTTIQLALDTTIQMHK